MSEEKQLDNKESKKLGFNIKKFIMPSLALILCWIVPSPKASLFGLYNFLENLLGLLFPTIILLLLGKLLLFPVRKFISPGMRKIIFWVIYFILFVVFSGIRDGSLNSVY